MVRVKDISDKGYFTIELIGKSGEPFCSIRDCRVVRGKNGPFVSGPSRKYTDRDGAEKYTNYTWLSDGIQKLVVEAYEAATKVEQAFADQDDVPF